MTKELLGIHHVTAITDNVQRNYDFFTKILGMRLVKKTVNQDDIQTYHTFYADDMGNAGTDMTFFDFNGIPSGVKGTNSISRTGFRVPNDKALDYYLNRFDEFGIKHGEIEELYGSKTLTFEEADGQRYRLFSDENNLGVPAGKPWQNGPVPTDVAIYGLGPVEITVSYFDEFAEVLEKIYDMKPIVTEENRILFEMGEGGNGARVILKKDTTSPVAREGYGMVHHVAFRVANTEALRHWYSKYQLMQVGNSGLVDRFYFEALYARVGHILIELSTDGPGFMQDEPYETLGEKLSLPPFLESRRSYIEKEVRFFDTSQTNKMGEQ